MNASLTTKTGPSEVAVIWIATQSIRPNAFNPRKEFSDADLVRFGLELKEHGIKQPIRVFQVSENYTLIGGERRWRACQAVGIDTMPAMIESPPLNEQALLIDQLSENSSESLSPLECADAYVRIMKLNQWSAADLAKHLRISPSQISRSLSVKSSLSPALRPLVQSGQIAPSVAYELCKVRNPDRQHELADRVLKGMTKAELVFLIQSERRQKEGTATAKPVKLSRSFDPTKGFESIRSELSALLNDVQRCEKTTFLWHT